MTCFVSNRTELERNPYQGNSRRFETNMGNWEHGITGRGFDCLRRNSSDSTLVPSIICPQEVVAALKGRTDTVTRSGPVAGAVTHDSLTLALQRTCTLAR